MSAWFKEMLEAMPSEERKAVIARVMQAVEYSRQEEERLKYRPEGMNPAPGWERVAKRRDRREDWPEKYVPDWAYPLASIFLSYLNRRDMHRFGTRQA
jgi:hypothetical protein